MNEKLENVLAKVLEKALEVAEQTGEFVMEQAPLLLQEFYAWKLAEHITWIAIFLLVIITGVTFVLKAFRLDEADIEEMNGSAIGILVCAILFGIGSIFCLINMFGEILLLIKLIVAPKIYLIDHFIK